MDTKKTGCYKMLVILFIAITTTLTLGCSRSSDSTALSVTDNPEQTRVDTDKFSFVYNGPKPAEYHEAPELAKLVSEGKLPPVEDRLPEEPLIVPPIERIGQYGGTWRRGFTGRADVQNFQRIQHDHLLYYDLDGQTMVPHIAKGWEVSDDGTTFTFHLRKGMKWSDGAPFTADDFAFAFEDVTKNEIINAVISYWFQADGQICQFEKIDDYTVRYTFHKPNFVFIERIASYTIGGQSSKGWICPLYAPAHYMKQFHPKYTPVSELNKIAEEEGIEAANWQLLFKCKAVFTDNPELPIVGPWKPVTLITGDVFLLVRNPYYFAVDPNGNQLPYIDRIRGQLVEDLEVFNARVIAGEIDMQHRHVLIDKVPVLKFNQVKGNYRILFWPNLGGSEAAIFINQSWEGDLEIEKWLRNRDFRIALSLAIDREEINESVFLGIGKPRAFVPLPDNMYYPGPEFEKKHAVRDLDKANEILDTLGLSNRDNDGYRLRTDSKERLIITLSVTKGAFVNFECVAELLVNHWKAIGLNIHLYVEERSFFSRRTTTNKHQMNMWVTGGSENPWTYPLFTLPAEGSRFAPYVGLWYSNKGEKGVAPTGDLIRMLEIFKEGSSLPQIMRTDIGKELWRIHSDNLYVIGTVGQSPANNGIVVVKNNFRNIPDIAPNSATLQTPGIARPDQFFFDRN